MAGAGNDTFVSDASTGQKCAASSALQLGLRKKLFIVLVLHENKLILHVRTTQDPLVHHGQHFGCAIHTFCNLQTLLVNELITMGSNAADLKSLTTM